MISTTPHVPFAKNAQTGLKLWQESSCVCFYALETGLSSFQHPRFLWLRPAHRSSRRAETTPGAQMSKWGVGRGLGQLLRGLTGSRAQSSFYFSARGLKTQFIFPFANCLIIWFLERKCSKWQKPEERRVWNMERSFLLGYTIKRNSLPAVNTNCSQENSGLPTVPLNDGK